ncbi:MAG: enoyl-CoA hydratase [Rhizobiales bacterium]|nr:enoyl-CoA hydratase [Hyphomicrobiales bacterium]
MSVEIERRGRTAVVRMANPPVNAISKAVRAALLAAVRALEDDEGVEAVVLTGAGRAFAAGADAREFDFAPEPPHLPEVVGAIERSAKPWVAAVHGAALGGGYELALGCRRRIAGPRALVGLPETTLGVVPGAGGTQRLARLVGIARAARLVAEGKSLKAEPALAAGLIDEIVDDPLERSLEVAGALVGAPAERLGEQAPPASDEAALAALGEEIARRYRGQTAPREALRLVASAAHVPFEEALAEERRTFISLRQSNEARALRHIFFAERAAAKCPYRSDPSAPVLSHVLVVGGGTMGSSIAYALDRAGCAVAIGEEDEAGVERARHNVGRLFDDAARRGLIDEAGAAAGRERIAVTASLEAAREADLVIEAVVEDFAVKARLLEALDGLAPAHAILATNTSYLDVDALARHTGRADRVLGLHFFSPAHIMKLLEIVRGAATSEASMASAYGIASRLGKIPVVAGVCDGFIGNRILARYREIADLILLEGATPPEVDEAMEAFGYAMGPYLAQDLSGLDIAYANRKRLRAGRDPARRYVTISDRMVEEGRLGRKTGVGWYRYPGGGGPVIDPLVEDLIAEEAHFARQPRRTFTTDEIQRRLIGAMVNEAVAILAEGIAATASDVDLVTVHGYGFPRWRGGLLHHADTVGAATILADFDMWAGEDPIIWRAHPALREIAAAGGRIADWRRPREGGV